MVAVKSQVLQLSQSRVRMTVSELVLPDVAVMIRFGTMHGITECPSSHKTQTSIDDGDLSLIVMILKSNPVTALVPAIVLFNGLILSYPAAGAKKPKVKSDYHTQYHAPWSAYVLK